MGQSLILDDGRSEEPGVNDGVNGTQFIWLNPFSIINSIRSMKFGSLLVPVAWTLAMLSVDCLPILAVMVILRTLP
jgi:hypothetical protein